ncbi:MAG: hypothetical protein ACTHZ9_02120 [Leucobacter sp.]
MARIEIHEDRVVVQLTAAEKILALRRQDIVIDRDAISSAVITNDPWVWLRGVRSPGTRVARRQAYGTWRNLAGRDFVLVRSGRKAVVLDLDSPEDTGKKDESGEFDDYARVILSTTHAAEFVSALRLTGDRSSDEVFTD